jgi:hypothetical protein
MRNTVNNASFIVILYANDFAEADELLDENSKCF